MGCQRPNMSKLTKPSGGFRFIFLPINCQAGGLLWAGSRFVMLSYPAWAGLLFWIPLRAKFMNISLLNIFMNNKNCFKLTSWAVCSSMYHPAILNIWHKNYLISTFDLTTSLPALKWKLFYILGQNQGINDYDYHLVFSLQSESSELSWGSQHNLNDCKPL